MPESQRAKNPTKPESPRAREPESQRAREPESQKAQRAREPRDRREPREPESQRAREPECELLRASEKTTQTVAMCIQICARSPLVVEAGSGSLLRLRLHFGHMRHDKL